MICFKGSMMINKPYITLAGSDLRFIKSPNYLSQSIKANNEIILFYPGKSPLRNGSIIPAFRIIAFILTNKPGFIR